MSPVSNPDIVPEELMQIYSQKQRVIQERDHVLHYRDEAGVDRCPQSLQMLGQLHQPNATLNIIILCRISPLYAVLVILGISLKLGQVISAFIQMFQKLVS